MMSGQNRKQQLARFIDEVSFAINDLVLFLDTHPCNQQAMACYYSADLEISGPGAYKI